MSKRPNGVDVTLCMIVKNETHIIEECLRSMAKYVDRYDITDTGSDDGTPELIKKVMDEEGVPGTVHLSDWKGFGDHAGKMGSRTEAVLNAKASGAKYAWMIDADDFIKGDFKYPDKMDADGYTLKIGRGDFVWWRNQIFNLESEWRYVGVLHEYAECRGKPGARIEKINGDYLINARTEGNRNVGISPVEKYSRDAEVLEEALKEEPENHRYWFYLGQSYFDSQQWDKSRDAYNKRASLGGWNEEVYYSLLRVAMIHGILQDSFENIAAKFLEAYNCRPIRAEPLYLLSRMYRQKDLPAIAYLYAKQGLEIGYPEHDILFIQDDIYKYGLLDEIGATAYYAGKPHVGYHACKKLLDDNLIPAGERDRVIQNTQSYEKILAEHHQQVAQQYQQQVSLQEKLKQREQAAAAKPKTYKKKKRKTSR